jgi:hypothetical protein
MQQRKSSYEDFRQANWLGSWLLAVVAGATPMQTTLHFCDKNRGYPMVQADKGREQRLSANESLDCA